MLLLCYQRKELNFSSLMEVYEEGNRLNGAEHYPDLPAGQQLMRAEQDFFSYLQTVFFSQPGDIYCIWEEDGRYVSALRLQAFRDGLLLEALETHPQYRCRGYAHRLIQEVLVQLHPERVYSHISPRNGASVAVHSKAGFRKISNHARYADGSFNSHCGTYLYDAKNAGV